jgi:hypothetical protein
MFAVRRFAALFALFSMLAACGSGDAPEAPSTPDTRVRALGALSERVPANGAVPAPALTARWQQLPNPDYAPPLGPYARVWTEMTWDPLRKEIVIFGGNGANAYDNDIWAYNGHTAKWTEIDPHVFCPGNTGFSKPN